MGTPPACQTCGAALAPGSSPAGLCPACLFTRALSDPGDLETSVEADPSGLAPGSTFGPFRIEAVLGKGGMSTVYRAHETTLDRVVALKVLPPEFLHDEMFGKRFQQEARVVAALEHPHVVPLYASGIEGGIPWMSMRLMAGGGLEKLVAGGRLDIRRILEILQAVASALDYAHDRGIVHRDVKPSNILLDRFGHVCVSDFGLAYLMERSLVHTRTGVIAGTPHYMAPEQGLGHEVDRRVDIYSLGVVAYEMLAGRPPFDADSPVAIIMKHAREPLPVPARDRVPEAMVPVLHKALAKEPGKRWSTASEFVNALSHGMSAPLPSRGFSRTAVWATGLAVAAVAGLLVLLRPSTPTDTSPRPVVEAAPAPPVEAATDIPKPEQPEPRPPAGDVGSRTPAGRSAPPASTRQAPVQLSPVQPPAVQSPPVQPSPIRNGPPETVPVGSTLPAVAVEGPPNAGPGVASQQNKPPPAGTPRPEAPAPNAAATPAIVGPVTVPAGDTVTQPVRVRNVNPVYPPLARAAQIEGDVVLQAAVGPDGRVTEVEVVRSVHPLLDGAARDAVLQYGYKPGLRNGAPDAFRVQVTVSFRLR